MRRCVSLTFSGLALAGLLTGCASSAVMVVSQTVNGVSYLMTGKGTTDHALSVALNEDCALHRIIKGLAVCRGDPKDTAAAGDIQTASLIGPPVPTSGAFSEGAVAMAPGARAAAVRRSIPGAVDPRTDAAVVAKLESASPAAGSVFRPSVQSVSRSTWQSAGAPGKRFFIVLGSYSTRGNAELAADQMPARANRMLARHPAPRVAAARIGGQTYYRIVVGPFNQTVTLTAQRQLATVGLGGAWTIPACDTAAMGGCIVNDD